MISTRTDLSTFSKNWGLILVWGILLLILGIMAISATTLTTVVSIVFLGFILIISGAIISIDAFTSWMGRWKGFFLHLFMGLLCLAAGFSLIKEPIFASISLTLLLGVFYIILGIFRIIASLSLKVPSWGWGFFNGLISLLLGVLITISWPASGLYIFGLFIGIDLIFCGWAYIMAALAARSISK